MGIFGKIMDKIFHHGGKPASKPTGSSTQQPQITPKTINETGNHPTPAPAAPPPPVQQQVDVGAVLATMAEAKGGGGNYQTSIVDLLKLLDLDSNLAARKELAAELGVHAGADGSAEQNIALHKAVMAKLAENGGLVPDSLRS